MGTINISSFLNKGAVKQLQYSVVTSGDDTNSGVNAYADSGLSVRITPSSASNKIVVEACFMLKQSGESINCTGAKFQLVRTIDPDGSPSATYLANGGYFDTNYSTATWTIKDDPSTIMYYDSPNTTSEIEYKIMHKPATSGTSLFYSNSSQPATIVAMEV